MTVGDTTDRFTPPWWATTPPPVHDASESNDVAADLQTDLEADPAHDAVVESVLPGHGDIGRRHVLANLLLMMLAAVVVALYVGLPLALFGLDFADRLGLAGISALILVLAIAGGLVRGLRATTDRREAGRSSAADGPAVIDLRGHDHPVRSPGKHAASVGDTPPPA